MRALRIQSYDDGGQLTVADIPRPEVPVGMALVAVRAAGVNPSDLANAAGRFPHTTLPRTPGRDFSGVVVAGPSEWTGTEVYGTAAELGFTTDGTHAEFVLVPQQALLAKPTRLSFEEAAAIGVPFVTAALALQSLKPGMTVAINGSRGSVGAAAVQIARLRGASQVLGVQRGTTADPNVDHVVDSEAPDLALRIRAATPGGKGPDLVLDTVGGPLFHAALAALAWGGFLVVIAAAGTGEVTFNLRDFYHQGLHLIGIDSLKTSTIEAAALLRELGSGFDSGALNPTREFESVPLDRAVEVYRAGRGGKKKILTMAHSSRI